MTEMKSYPGMANNLAVETNSAGDIKPSKKLAREKIDGIVALVMAISRGMVAKSSVETQITRGLIVASA
jgi:phage terminase large subunit-like protein